MYTEQVNCIYISFSTILSSGRCNFNIITEIRAGTLYGFHSNYSVVAVIDRRVLDEV
jgi:hypothetical protein